MRLPQFAPGSSALAAVVLALLTVALLPSALCRAQDEPVNADSSNVATGGKSQNANIKLYRSDGSPWREAAQNVSFDGTANRLRFKIVRPITTPGVTWRLTVTEQDSGSVLWEYTPTPDEQAEPGEKIFWSNTLYSKNVRATVTTSVEQNELQIVIDTKATFTPPTTPLSAVGTPYTAIAGQDASVVAMGRAVSLLRIQPDGKIGNRFCTGFLIGPDLLMTNRHCVTTGSEAGSTEVQFYVDDVSVKPTFTSRVKELVLASCDLDFVILRLLNRACVTASCDGPDDRKPVPLTAPAGQLTAASRLAVIQHPGPYPKAVAHNCALGEFSRMGNSTNLTDFGHKCNTDEGSSGSPVFLLKADGSIDHLVGLHHWGTRKDSATAAPLIKENLAVRLAAITSFIRLNNRDLADELRIP